MKHFIKVTVLFLLPVLFVVLLFCAALQVSGEFTPFTVYVEKAIAGEPIFFEQTYTNGSPGAFKTMVAHDCHAELFAIGTSRVMQLKQDEFPHAHFYNAGGAIHSFSQFRPMLSYLIEANSPKTVILCLDQFFFSGWDHFTNEIYTFSPVMPETTPLDAFSRILRDFSLGKVNLFSVFSADPHVIGISARSRGTGYYPDGSFSYGKLADHPDLTFPAEQKLIETGGERFLHSSQVDTRAVEELCRVLMFCQEHDIQVVAYTPPYAPSIYQKMVSSGNYDFLKQLPDILEDICQQYGAEFYDFTWETQSVDAEFNDGYHGGDRVYARMVKSMLEQGSLLNQYSSPKEIEELLALPSKNPRVLGIKE